MNRNWGSLVGCMFCIAERVIWHDTKCSLCLCKISVSKTMKFIMVYATNASLSGNAYILPVFEKPKIFFDICFRENLNIRCPANAGYLIKKCTLCFLYKIYLQKLKLSIWFYIFCPTVPNWIVKHNIYRQSQAKVKFVS